MQAFSQSSIKVDENASISELWGLKAKSSEKEVTEVQAFDAADAVTSFDAPASKKPAAALELKADDSWGITEFRKPQEINRVPSSKPAKESESDVDW